MARMGQVDFSNTSFYKDISKMKIYNIEISREISNVNKNFSYKLVDNDNNLIGELKAGETRTFQLTEKTKFIQAKLLFCSSKQIDISKLDTTEKLILSQNNFLNARLPLIGGLFPLIFAISRYGETLKIISTILLIALLIFIIGTLTVWKDRWLILKKKPSS